MFAAGYTIKLLELIKENEGSFEDPENVIEFVYNMGPHQSFVLNAPKGVRSYSHDHWGDPLSNHDMGGLVAAFTTDEKNEGVLGEHDVKSFVKYLKSFTDVWQKTRIMFNSLFKTS